MPFIIMMVAIMLGVLFFVYWQEVLEPWVKAKARLNAEKNIKRTIARTAAEIISLDEAVPVEGVYLKVPDKYTGLDQVYAHAKKDEIQCDVLGALALAAHGEFGVHEVELSRMFRGVSTLDTEDVIQILSRYFSTEEIQNIEIAYEGFSSLYENGNHTDDDDDQRAARRFYHGSSMIPESRMRSILEHIEKYGGFDPAQQTWID